MRDHRDVIIRDVIFVRAERVLLHTRTDGDLTAGEKDI